MAYKLKLLVLGAVSTNCYILYHEGDSRALVFDPADDAQRIAAALAQLSLKPEAILLTHGHFDHIMAVNDLKDQYGIQVYAHEEEADLAADPNRNLSVQLGAGCRVQPDRLLHDGQKLEAAGFHIEVMHTPGHTKGSVCYYLPEEQVLFSGDTLFAGSVGRTDFPTGSGEVLLQSLRQKVMVLPDDTTVYPGHGEQTDIAYEKAYNPFL